MVKCGKTLLYSRTSLLSGLQKYGDLCYSGNKMKPKLIKSWAIAELFKHLHEEK